MEDLTSDFLASDEALVILPKEDKEAKEAIPKGSAIVARKIEQPLVTKNNQSTQNIKFVICYEPLENSQTFTQALKKSLNSLLDQKQAQKKFVLDKIKFFDSFETISIVSKETLSRINPQENLKEVLIGLDANGESKLQNWLEN